MIPRPSIPINISAALGVILLMMGCRGVETSGVEGQATPRVVSLTPAITALITGLGEGAHLVGVTAHCDAPGIDQVGDMQPNIERVLAAEPDLVIAAAYPFNEEALARLRASGLNVLSFPLDSIDELVSATQALGERLGASSAARVMNDTLTRTLSEARATSKAWADDPPKALVVFDVTEGMVFTTGGGDHVASLMTAVGVENVAEGGPLTSRLSLERVIALAPDLIIHVNGNPNFPDDDTARQWWAKVKHIPAVGRDAIHVWPNDHLATVGPHLAGTIAKLTTWVSEHVHRTGEEVTP